MERVLCLEDRGVQALQPKVLRDIAKLEAQSKPVLDSRSECLIRSKDLLFPRWRSGLDFSTAFAGFI